MGKQSLTIVLIAALTVTAPGCNQQATNSKTAKSTARGKPSADAVDSNKSSESNPEESKTPNNDDRDAPLQEKHDAPTGESPPVKEEPKRITALKPPAIRPAVMPEVVLSASHASDCVVRVGDEFPDFRLPDASGRLHSVDDLRGSALSVVVFWSSDRAVAADELRFLDERIARYADLGVKLAAINVGESPAQASETVEDANIAFPVLFDTDRQFFARIGRGHLPRTYLLDRDGRILWFDIEFSGQTRDDLEQAIQASLKST